MSEKDSVYRGKVVQKGIFNFKDVYAFLYDYLVDENYDVDEIKYVEKISGDAKNLEIIWNCTKEVSDYFMFEITLTWGVLGMKKTKVKKGKQEVVMDSGTVDIKFTAAIIKDYENRWENNAFLKFMRGLYDRYIMKSRIDVYGVKVWEEVHEVIGQAKSFLAIEGHH
jgi:sigma54-dependent transcription regulator